MAHRGPWGTFIHIPKCAGTPMRYYLMNKYSTMGHEIGPHHDLPTDHLDGAWTIVRHPADWMRSYYGYLSKHNWIWGDRPAWFQDILGFADGAWWPQWVKAICNCKPSAVGQIYDHYCLPGVKVFRDLDIDTIFGEHIPISHVTPGKPVMTLEQWNMICKAEAGTLDKYSYGVTPPDWLEPEAVDTRRHWKDALLPEGR